MKLCNVYDVQMFSICRVTFKPAVMNVDIM